MRSSLSNFVLSAFAITSVCGAAISIERRREDARLYDPRYSPNNVLSDQAQRIIQGQGPVEVLNSYNKAADRERRAQW